MKNTASHNGFYSVLDDSDNSLIFVTDGVEVFDAEEYDFNTNPSLLQETILNQQDDPFLVDSEVNVSNLQVAPVALRQQLLTTEKSSINNNESGAFINAQGTPDSSPFNDKSDTPRSSQKGFGKLRYPIDAKYDIQEHIHIEQYEYKPPTASIFSQDFSDFTSGINRTSPIERFRGVVKLPIPSGIADSNNVSWNQSSIGPVQIAAVAAAMGIGDAIVNIVDAGKEGGAGEAGRQALEILTSSFDKFKTTIKDPVIGDVARREIISAAIKQIGVSVSPEEILTRATGRITNKNLELLFSGMNLRQFSFAFKMTPRGLEESQEIRRIIRFFKQGSAPQRSAANDTGSGSFFINTPNVFKLSYRKGNEYLKSVNKFKICACQSVNVNYAPDGPFMTYEDDSQPVAVSMVLSFTELTPIFFDDYEQPDEFLGLQPFDDDDVGF